MGKGKTWPKNPLTKSAYGRETTDLCGNFIAEVEAASERGVYGTGVVLSGVLIGEPEVPESRDGNAVCPGGKGACKVAENANMVTNDVSRGKNVVDTHVVDLVTTVVDGMEDKLSSGVNVTSVVLTVAVRVVVNVHDTLSHRPPGGVNVNCPFALTTNTPNGGVYVVNMADA